MLNSVVKLSLMCCACWLATSVTARAQSMRPFDRPGSRPYQSIESRPTVSPYVNLANNNGGLSNYQALVRPLLEEREELNRQWTALEQLNQQMHGSNGSDNRADTTRGSAGGRPSAVRFMHYSHYFSAKR